MRAPLPTLFLPHGGGPCFFMEWQPPFPADMWDDMAAFLRSVPAMLDRTPRAVLVVSGHWETRVATVLDRPENSLLYDYHGFPPHTYQLRYPAPGAPWLADRVAGLLDGAEIANARDHARGLDHGVFIPFLLIYPDADVPVVQLSLPIGASAAALMAIGRALAPLRDEDVLIVGSGMSYHNIAGILGRLPNQARAAAGFDAWLGEAATDPDPAARARRLAGWQQAPNAAQCHPTPEHLLPLFVAAGAGEEGAAERIYNAPTMGIVQSAFRFGDAA